MDGPVRIAAIDIGTNSVRMIVAEAGEENSYVTLADERDQTRLGYRLAETGRIDSGSVAATLSALESMKSRADALGVSTIRTVATAALREAENGPAVVRAAHDVGIEIEVISPEEEADLAVRSVMNNFVLGDEPVAVVDIGGGSMEIVITTDGSISEVVSLPLGAVVLTERFVRSDPVSGEDWNALCDEADRELEEALGSSRSPVREIIGSGGTFTTLAEMAPQGLSMTVNEVRVQADHLRGLSLQGRQAVDGLPPARADIILAGTAVVLRTARFLKAERVRVNDRGIRDGMILEMIARITGSFDKPGLLA